MIDKRASRIFRLSLCALTGFSLSGCISSATPHPGCETNFSTSGSFLTGKQFSTSEIVQGVPMKDAYSSLYKILAGDGYYIQSANEQQGVISAHQNVNLSDKQTPLNAVVKSSGKGAEVSLTFVAATGVFTPEGGARDEFCRIIHRVGN
ncbi:hypothetical protein HMH05_19485 [Pseudomonas sp. SbB1]|uniref:hypothetical protein n=1 Tax=Pseudomonas TaxID=286 RepID=UPI00123741D9|nr:MULTISPECIES: hypothetical protein [Pseudomonas]MBP0707852.1 hypothetical protein [Pseudomonas sp. T34]MCK2187293.1 hypothetical protein [Pseudomonas sp. MB04B]MDD2085458.1 hypothetical protein [Pseudomonas putida]MDD2095141.1 hypothetical protein [Pseudomonas putida]NOG89968.1 hypothetical protein [Pseudomonas sp. SbB1]